MTIHSTMAEELLDEARREVVRLETRITELEKQVVGLTKLNAENCEIGLRYMHSGGMAAQLAMDTLVGIDSRDRRITELEAKLAKVKEMQP